MPIILRTFGTDDNGAGASPFVAIPVPVGVRDGDLVLVGLTVPANTTITPPDEDWTLIARTPSDATVSVAVYAKTALNEGARWVFALSSSVQAAGGCLVYGSTDPFEPIEAAMTMVSASAGTHGVGAITNSMDGEELALFLGAATAGTYTAAAGWQRIENKQQASRTFEAHRRPRPHAGSVSSFSVAFSATTAGASVVVAIRPSVSRYSVDEVRERLIGTLPRGADRVYDLEPGGDYFKYFSAIALVFHVYQFELADILRAEIDPRTCRYKLPDWERVFALTTTRTARSGTIPQRQAQVVSAWREVANGAPSIPHVQAVVAPLLGYVDPSQVQVIEVSRAALTAANTRTVTGSDTIPASGAIARVFTVRDEPRVSSAGATVRLVITHPHVEELSVTLQSAVPDNATEAWAAGYLGRGSVTAKEYVLRAPSIAGASIFGAWQVTVANAGGNAGTLGDTSLFVEAVGRDDNGYDGLGSEIFHWGVLVEHALVGQNGNGADFAAAHAAVRRMAQAHTQGDLLFMAGDDQVGAIPEDDWSLADACLPD